VTYLRPGIRSAIRADFESHPSASLTLIEYSQPYDASGVGASPSIDSVLPRFRDAGFASALEKPLELVSTDLDSDHAPLLYPHIHANDVVVGTLGRSSKEGWNINVLRICNPKLTHLWNLRLKAVCPYSRADDTSSAVLKQKATEGCYVKGTITLNTSIRPRAFFPILCPQLPCLT